MFDLRHLGHGVGLVCLLAATACGEADSSAPAYESDDETLGGERMALIRVLARPSLGLATEVDPNEEATVQGRSIQLEVRADVAQYRGVDESLVRAYAGVGEPLWLDLAEGECTRGGSDNAAEHARLTLDSDGQQQSIHLLDAGRLDLTLGTEQFHVPLQLAPTVLSYATGVQYAATELELRADQPTESGFKLHFAGNEEPHVPAFQVSAQLPAALKLRARLLAGNAGELALDWQSPQVVAQNAAADRVILEVTPILETEALGTSVFCALRDSGSASISLHALGSISNLGEYAVVLRRLSSRRTNHEALGLLQVDLEMREETLVEQADESAAALEQTASDDDVTVLEAVGNE